MFSNKRNTPKSIHCPIPDGSNPVIAFSDKTREVTREAKSPKSDEIDPRFSVDRSAISVTRRCCLDRQFHTNHIGVQRLPIPSRLSSAFLAPKLLFETTASQVSTVGPAAIAPCQFRLLGSSTGHPEPVIRLPFLPLRRVLLDRKNPDLRDGGDDNRQHVRLKRKSITNTLYP